ncbi:MAG TPA: c-type cytochrome [Parafilimonas sp.]|nr:c-type cytochrome [Parafilimonas sp.]
MKCFLVLVACIFFACNSNQPDKSGINSNPTDSLINKGGTNIDSANETGSRLIAGNDCFTCHRIEEKNIGPSYREIARRYSLNQGNIENLAHKIITGGKGLWGQNAMTPHPNLPEPQAEEMVRYILSIKDSAQ